MNEFMEPGRLAGADFDAVLGSDFEEPWKNPGGILMVISPVTASVSVSISNAALQTSMSHWYSSLSGDDLLAGAGVVTEEVVFGGGVGLAESGLELRDACE